MPDAVYIAILVALIALIIVRAYEARDSKLSPLKKKPAGFFLDMVVPFALATGVGGMMHMFEARHISGWAAWDAAITIYLIFTLIMERVRGSEESGSGAHGR